MGLYFLMSERNEFGAVSPFFHSTTQQFQFRYYYKHCCLKTRTYSWVAIDVIAAMLEDDNKIFLISSSIVSSSNMTATSLLFDSLGTDCKPRILNATYVSNQVL